MESELNTNNLKIHELNNGVIDVIHTRCITPAIKKLIDIYEQSSESTQASKHDVIDYIVPEFNDDLINDLTNDKDIIENKNYKPETYKNKAWFYIKLTHGERVVNLFAVGHKPPSGYKHVDNLGNMYFVSDDWFIISGFSPFTQTQFYKLMETMYCFH